MEWPGHTAHAARTSLVHRKAPPPTRRAGPSTFSRCYAVPQDSHQGERTGIGMTRARRAGQRPRLRGRHPAPPTRMPDARAGDIKVTHIKERRPRVTPRTCRRTRWARRVDPRGRRHPGARLGFVSALDDFLRLVTDGLPPAPKRYELRCHPDVFRALQEASAAWPGGYSPGRAAMPGQYGTADVITDEGMQPGCWELREDGKVIRQAFRGPDGELYVYTPAPAGFGPSWRE